MKKLKILIADDEEFLQDLYEMIFESAIPCQFFKAGNGNEAITLLKENPDIDLIVSDYSMPQANGGKIYLFNKEHKNLPFIFITGGSLLDYNEFSDFHQTNELNAFLCKPFDDHELSDAAMRVYEKLTSTSESTKAIDASRFIKVKLSHYLQYTASAAEVYIKLSEDKFTKIIKSDSGNLPELDLLKHYQGKGIEFVYIERECFNTLLQDMLIHFHKKLLGEKKTETLYEFSGIPFSISFEGLNDIGINHHQIEKVNAMIEETVNTLLSDPGSQKLFKTLCADKGFAIGHSMLIMYIAGRICHEANLNFNTTMKKICTAAFYHDLSLFGGLAQLDELKPSEVRDPEKLKMLLNHPGLSADFLPKGSEVIEDTRRIILEHHELPNGNGYPKKLSATQIAPLSCLFILSQEITFCLLRNNFSSERLRDFLLNNKNDFNRGNFSKFYQACETIFSLNT